MDDTTTIDDVLRESWDRMAAATPEWKERPILFRGPLVRAILEDEKTVTRRPVKPQPPAGWDRNCWFHAPIYGWTDEPEVTDRWHKVRCPFGIPGDRLWVRETFMLAKPVYYYESVYPEDIEFWEGPLPEQHPGGHWSVGYPADGGYEPGDPKRPSIHMPRWASRITLRVVAVGVERLQDITPEDARAEGFRTLYGPEGDLRFVPAWDAIYAEDGLGWDANPWVWRCEFRRLPE